MGSQEGGLWELKSQPVSHFKGLGNMPKSVLVFSSVKYDGRERGVGCRRVEGVLIFLPSYFLSSKITFDSV